MSKTETEFTAQLKRNINIYVNQARLDGTTGMSWENLWASVRTPSSGLSGAPAGVNAGWAYRDLFRETIKGMRFENFNVFGFTN